MSTDALISSETESLIAYRCPACDVTAPLTLRERITCSGCGHDFGRMDDGILLMFEGENEQTGFHDELYGKALEETGGGHDFTEYEEKRQLAEFLAGRGGLDVSSGINGKTILEIACGTGWLSAGLMSHPQTHDTRFHCFDISVYGLKILQAYAAGIQARGNAIELSTLDANAMPFADDTFDHVIGSSVLHHFDEYHHHIGDCFRVLKPGGRAHYAEPFAIGHALAAGFLKIAGDQLERNNPRLNAYYAIMSKKINLRHDKGFMAGMMDKHLFFRDDLVSMAHKIGFSDVQIVPRNPYNSYRRGGVVEAMARKRGIDDREVLELALSMYSTFFEMFGETAYDKVFPNFMDVVLIK